MWRESVSQIVVPSGSRVYFQIDSDKLGIQSYPPTGVPLYLLATPSGISLLRYVNGSWTTAWSKQSVSHVEAVFAATQTAQGNASFTITPNVSRFQPFLILSQRSFLFVIYGGSVTKLSGASELTVTQDLATGKVTVSNGVANTITMLIISYNAFTIT